MENLTNPTEKQFVSQNFSLLIARAHFNFPTYGP